MSAFILAGSIASIWLGLNLLACFYFGWRQHQ
jgi:hypothetical protein